MLDLTIQGYYYNICFERLEISVIVVPKLEICPVLRFCCANCGFLIVADQA